MQATARPWKEWDAKIAEGADPQRALLSMRDDAVIALLASAEQAKRPHETALVVAELENRFARLRMLVEETTDVATGLLERVAERSAAGMRLLPLATDVNPSVLARGRELTEAAVEDVREARARLLGLRASFQRNAPDHG